MNRTWSWTLVAVLLVVALGCSLGGLVEGVQEVGEQAQELVEEAEEMAEEMAEETADPDAEAPAEDEPAEKEELPESVALDPDALEGLDSYRYIMVVRSEMADGTVEEMIMDMAATRDPAAQHVSIIGVEGEAGGMEIIQIGNQQWIKFGEEWMQTEVAEEDAFDFSQEDLPFSADDIDAQALEDAKFVGKETMNGLPTRHYKMDTNVLETEVLGWESMVENLEDASMDVWIADKADLPAFAVRLIVDVTGSAPEEQTDAIVRVNMTMDVKDVNANFTIEPPEAAATGGLPEDIPVYPNRQNQTSMSGMLAFETEDDLATVVDFYTSEMESAGWSMEEGAMSTDTMEMQTWTKDTRSAQVMISKDEDAELTSVTVILQGEE